MLVGHSFGGRVGVVVASQHPELVESLVLTGVPLLRTHASARSPLGYRSVRWLAKRHLVSESRLEKARQKYGSTDYQRAHGVMRDVLVASVNESYESELAQLTMPVAFVWGERDEEAPYEVATRAAALVTRPDDVARTARRGPFRAARSARRARRRRGERPAPVNLALEVSLSALLALGYCAQMARWLRVLHREHYDPTSMVRFRARWTSPPRLIAKVSVSHVLVLAMIVVLALRQWDLFVIAVVIYGLICPWGLSLRGRTSQLDWTRRLRATAIVAGSLSIVAAGLGALAPHPLLVGAVMVLFVPLLLGLATRILRPYEERDAQRFVDQAVQRLARVHPRIVAITGSYGKTSTKNYLSSLLADEYGVVASPRSYNNRAGLSRAINENLDEGTRVFIAEMGTYGLGEIRELTSWCPPEIAVITAIGPVHLERMGSLEVVEAAKREITERATTVVLNVDDPRLAAWPESLRSAGKRVITAGSTNRDADIQVTVEPGGWSVRNGGSTLAVVEEILGVQPTNLACALGVGVALGVD